MKLGNSESVLERSFLLELLPFPENIFLVKSITCKQVELIEATAHPDTISAFTTNNVVSIGGLVELSAQSASAFSIIKQDVDTEIKNGFFVVAIENLKSFFLPLPNQPIISSVTYQNSVLNYHYIRAVVSQNNKVCASFQLILQKL